MNTMSGYGEFYWKDGKAYKGGYVNDKKEGFGTYYWADPSRLYIGFWQDGKQHGIGKYISSKSTKWGKWVDGERITWYDSKIQAFDENHIDINSYESFFEMGMREGMDYVSKSF